MNSSSKNVRAIAIHLPQFHTIPENDKWWGKGFTEWTNVKKAKPLFGEHYQPHVPLNNNYYDLSENEVLCNQADLAGQYGIDGFCFYHYWFNGKKLLEKPLEQMLELQKPNFPFMLCWANENWTRTWDGMENDVLMKQEYSLEDDEAHFDYLLPFFRDQRYITIDGKPVFLIYRSELFPDIIETTKVWRKLAAEAGLPGIYLIYVERFIEGTPPKRLGFDASMKFHPNGNYNGKETLSNRIRNVVVRNNISTLKKFSYNPYLRKVFKYSDYIKNCMNSPRPGNYKNYPCVFPSWDNSARKKNGATIYSGSSPYLFKKWLKYELDRFTPYSNDENFIFLNAWNEWAEGNHLEPCEKWEMKYLEALNGVRNCKR